VPIYPAFIGEVKVFYQF